MYDEQLTNLDEGIRRLKIEYDIFFNGNRKRPPDDARMRVEKMVKKLAEVTDMSFSQRFRYNTLIARFYVYRDLWRRTQMELESAEEHGAAKSSATPNQAAKSTPEATAQAIEISIQDPRTEAEKVQQLYQGLLGMRGNKVQGPLDVSYQQFADYIDRQTQSIRKKYQCTDVTFRIALEESAIRFTAKADRGKSD